MRLTRLWGPLWIRGPVKRTCRIESLCFSRPSATSENHFPFMFILVSLSPPFLKNSKQSPHNYFKHLTSPPLNAQKLPYMKTKKDNSVPLKKQCDAAFSTPRIEIEDIWEQLLFVAASYIDRIDFFLSLSASSHIPPPLNHHWNGS